MDLQLRGPARALAERGTAAGAAALEARFGAPALDAAAAARRSSLSLAEPSHPPRLRMGPPPHELVLEHVHGFRGRDARGSLHALACGDLFFPAAGVCVVMDAASREQEFFSEHEREVTASAVHPGGVLVATGEAGREPLVIVWDAERMQAQARLGACSLEGLTSYGGPVRALAFSPCGARLVALGGDSHNTLVVWDWRAKTPLFGTRTGRHAVLAAAFAPRAPLRRAPTTTRRRGIRPRTTRRPWPRRPRRRRPRPTPRSARGSTARCARRDSSRSTKGSSRSRSRSRPTCTGASQSKRSCRAAAVPRRLRRARRR